MLGSLPSTVYGSSELYGCTLFLLEAVSYLNYLLNFVEVKKIM